MLFTNLYIIYVMYQSILLILYSCTILTIRAHVNSIPNSIPNARVTKTRLLVVRKCVYNLDVSK